MSLVIKNKKTIKICFFVIVAIQLLFISALINRIVSINKASKVLGSIDIAVESNKNIYQPEGSEFEYYYEFEPSIVREEIRWWNNSKALKTINSDGINDRFDYDTVKPGNTFRIIALGDSFTYGQFIDTSKNWTEKLEDLLNDKNLCKGSVKYEVINLGMGGFDVPYIVKRFKNKGLKYNPDLIIWFESGAGFYRDRERMRPLYQKCKEEFLLNNNSKDLPPQEHTKCWNKSEQELIDNTPPYFYKVRLSYWMKYFLDLVGETPVVIGSSSYIEASHEELLRALDGVRNNFYYTNSITLIDLAEGTVISEYDGHPSEKGHTLFAEDFFKFITSDNRLGVNCN